MHFVIIPITDQNKMQTKTNNLSQNETAVINSPILTSYDSEPVRPMKNADILCRIAAAFVSLRETVEWRIGRLLLCVLSKYLRRRSGRNDRLPGFNSVRQGAPRAEEPLVKLAGLGLPVPQRAQVQ